MDPNQEADLHAFFIIVLNSFSHFFPRKLAVAIGVLSALYLLSLPNRFHTEEDDPAILQKTYISWCFAVFLIMNATFSLSSGFLSYGKSLLYLIFPAARFEKTPSWKWVFLNLLQCLITGTTKLLLGIFFRDWILRQYDQPLFIISLQQSYFMKIVHALIAFGFVTCSLWSMDIICGFFPLLTLRRMHASPFLNYPILSQSLREFWSQRYNLFFTRSAHFMLFKPLTTNANPFTKTNKPVSPTIASFLTFLYSGLFHAHLAILTFGGSGVDAMITFSFFLLHAAGCTFERYIFPKSSRKSWWRSAVVLGFVVVTAPMVLSLHPEKFRSWILMGDLQIPSSWGEFVLSFGQIPVF